MIPETAVTVIFKIIYWFYRLLAGLRHRAERRLTPAGLLLVVALVLAGLMAPDTDNNLAYQAFVLLLSLLALSVVFSCFFKAQFEATRLLPRFGTVGSVFNYKLALRNVSSKRQGSLTLLEDLADPTPPFHEWLSVQLAQEKQLRSFRFSQRPRHTFKAARITTTGVPPLTGGEETEVMVEMTPLRRGLLRLAGVTLARPDPLGLFHSFAKVPLPQTMLILPKRYPLPPIALPGAMKYQQGGIALASSVGQSDEFVSLREYRQGDPWRHIHWRSWARAGQPVVREFADEFLVRHALVLDTFTDDPHSEIFEEAISVAASFAWSVQTQESLLDLLFVGPESYCFTAGRGLAHADQMLEMLASVRPCPQQSFSSLEHLVLNHINAVSGCICVLLGWEQHQQNLVCKIKALGVPLLVFIIVARGHSTALAPGPMRDEPGRFHALEVGQIEQGLATLK